jgi:hypothetical protein
MKQYCIVCSITGPFRNGVGAVADPELVLDQAFHADAEQDPASRNDADPCESMRIRTGSGSATLAVGTVHYVYSK